VALIAFSYFASSALSQDNVSCGNLFTRVRPDTTTKEGFFTFQVFRRAADAERPILPGTFVATNIPNARCIGTSVLVIAFFPLSGDPSAVLVFPNGHHQLELLSAGEFEFRDDAIVIPARPRLPQRARERVPAEYRDLFDYGGP
jgi:hypothetical protein